MPINGENNDAIDEFEEVLVEETCDLRQFTFDALKEIRMQVCLAASPANDVKKLQKINAQHKFRYVNQRGYCSICLDYQSEYGPQEDDETTDNGEPDKEESKNSRKSTQLVCFTCVHASVARPPPPLPTAASRRCLLLSPSCSHD